MTQSFHSNRGWWKHVGAIICLKKNGYSIIDSQEPDELLRILWAFGPQGGEYFVGQSEPLYPQVKSSWRQPSVCTTILANYSECNEHPQGFVDSEDNLGDITPGQWRSIVTNSGNNLSDISRLGSNRYSFEASNIRLNLKSYCNSLEGSVSWQLAHIRSCGRRN